MAYNNDKSYHMSTERASKRKRRYKERGSLNHFCHMQKNSRRSLKQRQAKKKATSKQCEESKREMNKE